MSSIALLTFTMNDVGSALPLIERIQPHVDEIVVIDSSNADQYGQLRKGLEGLGASVHRTIPVGDVDLLRPFGVSRVRTERVFIVESDETPSPELLAGIPMLDGAEAYDLPRFEDQLGFWTHHLRLYRKNAVEFPPESYAYPIVHGRIQRVHPPWQLNHRADLGHYLDSGSRGRAYFSVESYERPVDSRYFAQSFGLDLGEHRLRLPGIPWLARQSRGSISPPAVQLSLAVEALRAMVLDRSWAAARFRWAYAQAVLGYVQSLPVAERARRRRITGEIRAAGGLVRYLGFDDPRYIERVTDSFPWDRSGPQVLEGLIDFRSTHPAPFEGPWV